MEEELDMSKAEVLFDLRIKFKSNQKESEEWRSLRTCKKQRLYLIFISILNSSQTKNKSILIHRYKNTD